MASLEASVCLPLSFRFLHGIGDFLVARDKILTFLIEGGIGLRVEKQLVIGVAPVGQSYVLVLTHQVGEIIVHTIRKAVIPTREHF
jgi:hypothetical protein